MKRSSDSEPALGLICPVIGSRTSDFKEVAQPTAEIEKIGKFVGIRFAFYLSYNVLKFFELANLYCY